MKATRKFLREWQLVLPLCIFFVAFVLAPLAMLAFVSSYTDPSLTVHGATQYQKFFGDGFNLSILGQTLWLALRTTVLAVILGFPLAYAYSRASARQQRIIILLIIMPLLTSSVVRTFAWIVILGRQGIINNVLLGAGILERPLSMLYTPGAVVVALAQVELPLMALPIITALSKIDPNLILASRSLGARQWRTFLLIVVPLSMPGLLAGCLLVFAAASSAFVVHTLIGGGQNIFMPLYIYQQGIQANNYPFAAAIAMVLLVSVMVVVTAANMAGRYTRGWHNA